ncbi:hypothetical protein BJ912DRAFT_699314 [Pholiota molesta]|nr:hypothetical protein BJ912DRAFT_699314 [Pholiota molesta]
MFGAFAISVPDVCGYLYDGPTTNFSKISIFGDFNPPVKDDPFQDDATTHFETCDFEWYGGERRKRRGQIGYSHSDRSRQRYVPTLAIPSAEEKEAAREAFLTERKLKYRDFQKIIVPAINDPAVETAFIFPFPLEYRPCSPFSGAIRPTPSFGSETKKLIVLKEYWRPRDVAGGNKEGDIYTILHAHECPNIALFGTGNDLCELVTRTQEFANKDCSRLRWSPGKNEATLTPLRQYRMTLPIIGKSLTDFKTSKEFVSAIADAMKAHDAAYFKANILHSDISVGNILISDSGGLLIDWDSCVTVDPAHGLTRPRKRTGTWQFMSVSLLRNPITHHHDIEDDRESAFYVLL